MWRNDTNGNKTLCNACGVRLQRQLNKQKQQSQAIADNSTSLIAGKLPRSRTSPAKLSRQDLPRSCSQDLLRQAEGFSQKGMARSLTLIHNSSGQPTLTIAQGAILIDLRNFLLIGRLHSVYLQALKSTLLRVQPVLQTISFTIQRMAVDGTHEISVGGESLQHWLSMQ